MILKTENLAKTYRDKRWFAPEREMLQALIDKSQEFVSGTVRMKLYKGNATVVGRESKNSLYRQDYVTFEKDSVYNQKDAEGFIKLNALRMRIAANLAARKAGAPAAKKTAVKTATAKAPAKKAAAKKKS